MDLICQMEKTNSVFEDNWNKYVDTILQYSQSQSLRSKDVKAALSLIKDDYSCGTYICMCKLTEGSLARAFKFLYHIC